MNLLFGVLKIILVLLFLLFAASAIFLSFEKKEEK